MEPATQLRHRGGVSPSSSKSMATVASAAGGSRSNVALADADSNSIERRGKSSSMDSSAGGDAAYIEKVQYDDLGGVEAATTRLKGLVEADRWTASLVALWCMLFLALFVNKKELWVVMAGLVGYACLCFLMDVAIPIPLKRSQRTRLSNGLVCIAHCVATGVAAGMYSYVWSGLSLPLSLPSTSLMNVLSSLSAAPINTYHTQL